MVIPRIREIDDYKEMQKVIDDYYAQGYTIKSQVNNTVLMKYRTWGTAMGFALTIFLALILTFWTIGLSWLIPVIYAVCKNNGAPEVLLRISEG
jgi:hypothetical protein